MSPTVPVLLQILSGAQSATDLLPAGSVYVLPPNSVVELSMPAGAAGGPVRVLWANMRILLTPGCLQHPFHLHGVGGLRYDEHNLADHLYSMSLMLCGVLGRATTTMLILRAVTSSHSERLATM